MLFGESREHRIADSIADVEIHRILESEIPSAPPFCVGRGSIRAR